MAKYFIVTQDERLKFDKGKTTVTLVPSQMVADFVGEYPTVREINDILNQGKKITFMQRLADDE